jgi:hypothetical protein
MWSWTVNEMTELVSANQHLNSGTNLRECEDQSWFKVQAFPVFRSDWCKTFSRTTWYIFATSGTRVPQVEDHWYIPLVDRWKLLYPHDIAPLTQGSGSSGIDIPAVFTPSSHLLSRFYCNRFREENSPSDGGNGKFSVSSIIFSITSVRVVQTYLYLYI